ncbi:MAG: hypothetical protein RLZZ136_1641 [Pseudomonadota bacterium]|jgi:hypothetical protein
MRLFAWLFLALAVVPVCAQGQTFDNHSVITLHRAGLGADVITAKIRALPCNYDISTDGLIALKTAGIGQDVIVEMVQKCTGSARAQGINGASGDPLSKHPPGIYLAADQSGGAKLILLHPTSTAGIKLTGNGSLLFPYMAKLTVPQAQAQLVSPSARPTFYFYFDSDDRQVNTFGTVSSLAAQSPNEFSLVRFRSNQGARQFVIGRVQPLVEVLGIDPKNALAFEMAEVGDGIFRISFSSDLVPGEYGFILPGAKSHFRIYDFSVSNPALVK